MLRLKTMTTKVLTFQVKISLALSQALNNTDEIETYGRGHSIRPSHIPLIV